MGDPTKGRLTSLPPGEAARLPPDIQGCTRMPFCSLKILDEIFFSKFVNHFGALPTRSRPGPLLVVIMPEG